MMFATLICIGFLIFLSAILLTIYRDIHTNDKAVDETCSILDRQIGYNQAIKDYLLPRDTWTKGVSLRTNYKIPKFISKRKPRYLKRSKDVRLVH